MRTTPWRRMYAVAALSVALTLGTSGCMVQLPSGNSTPVQTQSAPTQQRSNPDESSFLRDVGPALTDTIYVDILGDEILEAGYSTCGAHSRGASRSEMVEIAERAFDGVDVFTPNAPSIFVDAAIRHLC